MSFFDILLCGQKYKAIAYELRKPYREQLSFDLPPPESTLLQYVHSIHTYKHTSTHNMWTVLLYYFASLSNLQSYVRNRSQGPAPSSLAIN